MKKECMIIHMTRMDLKGTLLLMKASTNKFHSTDTTQSDKTGLRLQLSSSSFA